MAHQGEAFARMKRVPKLPELLKRKGGMPADAAAADVLGMFKGMQARGAGVTVKRIGKRHGVE
jgi:hypothetical protein